MTPTRLFLTLGLTGCMTLHPLMAGMALAYAPEAELLKTKGYSPEIINTMEAQRSRQEWRQPPAPILSPIKRFMHNIYYNEWTGSIDEFGAQVLRER